MSLVGQITANTFAIRELEAAIGELKERCVRRDSENAQLLAELEATSEQLFSMWQIMSGAEAAMDDTAIEAFRPGQEPAEHAAQPNGAGTRRAPEAPPPPQPLDLAPPARAAEAPSSTPAPAPAAALPTVAEGTQTAGALARLAPARPDFTGTWVLSQSINFKEYLEATGVTWAKRQIAAKLRPVQDWALADEGVWEFSMHTPIGRRVERIVVNGTVDDEIDGLQVVKESFWDRDELVTLCRPRDPSKAAAPTEFRRRHEKPADRLVLEIVTGKARCTRIFERQPG